MIEETGKPEQVHIVIECIPDLQRFVDPAGSEGRTFQDLLQRRVDSLATDLGLPVTFSLDMKLIGDEKDFALHPYRVAIDGQPCMFPPLVEAPQGWTAQQMALSVAKVVYLNRELCVNTSVVERILVDLSTEREKTFLAGFSIEAFQRLLRELVRRCSSVDRLKNIEALASQKDQSNAEREFETVLESVLSAQGAVFLKVYSNPVFNKKMLVASITGGGTSQRDQETPSGRGQTPVPFPKFT